MKEFIAETGGRYTYTDDYLNLQELAQSFTSIFEGCSNFIISGCIISGNEVSEGYVWINGKVRYFAGTKDCSFPYYIYERNSIDTVTYANEVNKKGRIDFSCSASNTIPDQPDVVTNMLPGYIEIRENYAPRLIDKFFGKYAVLLDSPFSKQTIKKDLVLVGKLSVEKDIESKTSLSVENERTGYSLKSIIKPEGNGSVGLYLKGLLINEVVLHTDGTIRLYKGQKLIATINEEGIISSRASYTSANIGLLHFGETFENIKDASDEGQVSVNLSGYNLEGSRYRNFSVYDGKYRKSPIFKVEGKTAGVFVDGIFTVTGEKNCLNISNKTFSKDDIRLTNAIFWKDNANELIASFGYVSEENFDFSISNTLGNIILFPKSYVNIDGELRIKGANIADTYVTKQNFTSELKKKVDIVEGKQLSTEDFTNAHLKKLDGISTGFVGSNSQGYVTAKDVTEAFNKKLSIDSNLSDLQDKAKSRLNLGVYSQNEVNTTFLKISAGLQELVNLTADEINNMTPEQAGELKAAKQKKVRDVIDAEQKGTGDLKLAKATNLSDLTDKVKSRKNLGVYSTEEIDEKLKGYLPNTSEYTGVTFTPEHRKKLEGIKTGNFAGIDVQDNPIHQTEGYALISHIVKEFDKKANLLMDGYDDVQKRTIANNIGVYIKSESDAKYANVEQLFQDFITFLVKQGKTTSEAQKVLRDKLDVPSKTDVTSAFLRKDSKLTDLVLANANVKKEVCRTLGAAYADEYQPKIKDSGWLKMNNSGANTYANDLYVRQIGNIVSIQGVVYNNRRDGSHNGGVIAVIPNQIDPPKHSIKNSLCTYNDDHKYNRGASYVIWGNSRKLVIYESGWAVQTEFNITYMV